MACYRPIQAYQTAAGSVVFTERGGDIVRSLSLSCGECVGCRMERSREWAIRIVHEASLYEQNCFLTLTYGDAYLPAGGLLSYLPFQLFMRRLRRSLGSSPRFFMCGEYGEAGGRPHYHAIIFGYDFPDKYYFRKSPAGEPLYRSPALEKLWQFGHSSIGTVTQASAAYVARYATKKVLSDGAGANFTVLDPVTGELTERPREFVQMSRKPGIGRDWIRLYWPEVLQRGEVIVDGKPQRAPKAYKRYLRSLDGYAALELLAQEAAVASAGDNTPERLRVKEEVAKARLRLLTRKL